MVAGDGSYGRGPRPSREAGPERLVGDNSASRAAAADTWLRRLGLIRPLRGELVRAIVLSVVGSRPWRRAVAASCRRSSSTTESSGTAGAFPLAVLTGGRGQSFAVLAVPPAIRLRAGEPQPAARSASRHPLARQRSIWRATIGCRSATSCRAHGGRRDADQAFVNQIPLLAANLALLLVAGVVMLALSPLLSLVFLVFVPLFVILAVRYATRSSPASWNDQRLSERSPRGVVRTRRLSVTTLRCSHSSDRLTRPAPGAVLLRAPILPSLRFRASVPRLARRIRP